MPFFKNISNLASNFLNSRNIKNSTNIKTGTSNNIDNMVKNLRILNTSIKQSDFGNQVNIKTKRTRKKLKNIKSENVRYTYTSDAISDELHNYPWKSNNRERSFFDRSWRKFTGQTGQEINDLSNGKVQTFKEGMQFLTAKDRQDQRLRTQAGRIGIRQGIVGAGIGGAWAANALRKDIQNPDELINRLEQPITYGNGYTQQYPSSYRDRLINILNNTTL